MRSRGFVFVFPLIVLMCVACERNDLPENVTAESFTSCSELEAKIKETALLDMNARIDESIEAVDRAALSLSPDGAASANEAARDYTTTNVQERGVDEADFVKNDGSRIFVLDGRRLVSLTAWPPEEARIDAVTSFDGVPEEMFYDGSQVVVFSRVDFGQLFEGLGLPDSSSTTSPGDYVSPCIVRHPESAAFCRSSYGMKITVLDVTSSSPRVTYELAIEGAYLDSRRVGRFVRVVSTSTLRGPVLQYWPDGRFDWSDIEEMKSAFEDLRRRNARAIQESRLEDWLPRVVEIVPGDSPRLIRPSCTDCLGLNAPTRLGLTTILTLNLASLPADKTFTTMLSTTDEIYASRYSLYLSTRHHERADSFRRLRTWRPRQHTYLHRFDISESAGRRPRHTASGGVPGHVLDPFSFDEADGYLRVATSEQSWSPLGEWSSTNNVFVLAAHRGRLVRVGAIRDIASGERLYAARFQDRHGYLVTFRMIDPLFTLDLSRPDHPFIAGELKVPGFSTYIHPLPLRHLLTIGRDVTPDGQVLGGLQLQIFDVTDFASPRLAHQLLLGSSSARSEAAYEHKAFNFFESRGLLAIPFTDWDPSTRDRYCLSTLELFRINLTEGISALGSIDHSDLVNDISRDWSWSPAVRRSVFMEDYLYSISSGGVKIHSVSDLYRPFRTIPFPAPEG